MRKAGADWLIWFGALQLEEETTPCRFLTVDFAGMESYRGIKSVTSDPVESVDSLPSQPVTELLAKWKEGDPKALEELVPLVYQQLREIAHRSLQRERFDHTLQTTALVHEAYLRMVGQGPPDVQNRSHFAAVAARLMRQILVDYARARRAAKRGGDCRVELDEAFGIAKKPGADVLALDDALKGLVAIDEQQSRIVELRFFGGLTIEETAYVLGIAPVTVKRDWNVAKAWLTRAMRRGTGAQPRTVEKD